MKAVLWGIALATLCLLQTAAALRVQPDFDPNKFAGKWFDIAIIYLYGDSKLKAEDGHHTTIVATKEGKLIFHGQIPRLNCKREEYVFTMTGKPGKYNVLTSDAYILKTDYTNSAIIYVESPGEQILHLFARKQDVSEDVKEEFRKLVVSMNLPVHNIIYFQKTGPCPKLTFPEVS